MLVKFICLGFVTYFRISKYILAHSDTHGSRFPICGYSAAAVPSLVQLIYQFEAMVFGDSPITSIYSFLF